MGVLEQKEEIKRLWEGKIDSYTMYLESAKERVRLIDLAVRPSFDEMVQEYENGGTKVEEQELFFYGYGNQRVVCVSFGSRFILSEDIMWEFLDYLKSKEKAERGIVKCFFGESVICD